MRSMESAEVAAAAVHMNNSTHWKRVPVEVHIRGRRGWCWLFVTFACTNNPNLEHTRDRTTLLHAAKSL